MNLDSNDQPKASAHRYTEHDATAQFWNEQVLPVLEQIAERHLRGEREAITLEAGDLVHEAYLRLSDLVMPLNDRQHFVSMVSTTMRRVLVDHARRKHAAKRGDRPLRITLQSREGDRLDHDAFQLLELDELLTDLSRADPRKAEIVEMHYFGGLTRSEMSDITGLSPATLGRELSFARSWIHAQLSDAD